MSFRSWKNFRDMARFRSIIDPARRFLQLPNARLAVLLEASLVLLVVRIGLLAIPFRLIAARLGTPVAPHDALVRASLAGGGPKDAILAAEIAWAVTRAARFVPFKAQCLPQAIAAKWMLSRRAVASVLYFGAARSTRMGKPIESHAWLNAANVEVTGYPVAHQFSEIACYV